MNTTRDALMRAILVDPFDDTVRLVLADWLEENGEAERAEFVRVQCELENLRKGDGSGGITIPRTGEQCKRWKWLSEREREIMGTNLFLSWCGRTVAKNVNESRYRRGFIWYIGCTLANWMQHGPRIVAEQPVTEVRTDAEPFSSSGTFTWFFNSDKPRHRSEEPSYLPEFVFALLEGEPVPYHRVFAHKDYPTEAAAQSALSLALVNWARREAGLPPIPHPADAREGDETR